MKINFHTSDLSSIANKFAICMGINMKRKICIVTGTRAEYGLLKPLIKRVISDSELELFLYVTGAHLSPEFGLTYREIEGDNIPIKRKIEMLLSADTSSSVVKAMGIEMIGFADALAEDRPDIMVVLGDRYEILAAAIAAMICKIPIAHIHGGELTEGLIDEASRHSITKMSYLHFTTTDTYRKRIIQLGEQPDRVFNVGSLGIESIKTLTLLTRRELEEQIKFSFAGKIAMVTYHPVTLESEDEVRQQFENLLDVLRQFSQLKIIFTKANADMGGRIINGAIDDFVAENKGRCAAYESLGQLRYLSALQFCSIVIGNSSSGIIEAPSFHIPTVNIGDRQRGRVYAASVINCENTFRDINRAVSFGLSEEALNKMANVANPYERPDTSENIIKIIKAYFKKGIDIKKVFYDMQVNLSEG